MVVRTFPTVVRTAEWPIANSVRPFSNPVPKPRSGPPDLDRPKQYEWPQSNTPFASLVYRCVAVRQPESLLITLDCDYFDYFELGN